MFFRPALVVMFLLMILPNHIATASSARQSPPRTQSVDRILIDPNKVQRVISSTFFGINYSAFWEPAEGSSAGARALAQTPIRVVRFPGGAPADSYDWQDPYYKNQSQTSPLQLWEWARSFGTKQVLFQTNFQGNMPNPPGKPYAVNSPENAAAWVEYDKLHGIPAQMEVGNEEDWHIIHTKDDPRYSRYITAFNDQAEAMHQVDPHVQVLGPVATSEWYWRTLDSLGMFLRGTGNRTGTGQVDGVSLHFYDGSNWFDAIRSAQYWLSPQGPWAAIQSLIHANDTRSLPVYVTEWNLGNKDFHNSFNPTLGHALLVADMLGAFALSGVTSADYFTIHRSDGWGLFYGTNDARPVDTPTPTYYAMALWSHMGNRMLALHQSMDARGVASAYATTRRNGSVQVLVVNKQHGPRRIQIQLQRRSPQGHHLRVFSLTPQSRGIYDLNARYDGQTMPSPQRQLPGAKDLGEVRGKTVSYTVPGYSAVVLELGGTSPAPGLTWRPLPPPKPDPGPSIAVGGGVRSAQIKAGRSQLLTALVRSSAYLGPAFVDLVVYDSAGAKVFAVAQKVVLRAHVTIKVSKVFKIPISTWSGKYKLVVGVATPDGSTQMARKDSAGIFTVAGTPRPNVLIKAAISPSNVVPGGTATFVAGISAKNAALSNAMVDFEVYDSAGHKVWTDQKTGINVPRDGSLQVSDQWIVPGQTAGTYILKIGVFGPNWQPLFAWNDKAGLLSVGPQVVVTGQVNPTNPYPGGTATFVAGISAKNAALSNAMVDFEVYDSAGHKVWTDQKTGINIQQNGTASVADQYVIPDQWTKGSYVLKIGVFGANWKPLYAWNDKAATFTL